jgi:hypothetical protein
MYENDRGQAPIPSTGTRGKVAAVSNDIAFMSFHACVHFWSSPCQQTFKPSSALQSPFRERTAAGTVLRARRCTVVTELTALFGYWSRLDSALAGRSPYGSASPLANSRFCVSAYYLRNLACARIGAHTFLVRRTTYT